MEAILCRNEVADEVDRMTHAGDAVVVGVQAPGGNSRSWPSAPGPFSENPRGSAWAMRLAAVHRWVAQNNIALLRISMGAVILGFGLLKYLPGASPAHDLVLRTNTLLTFGLIPPDVSLFLLATVECVLGGLLIVGRGLRVIRYLLVLFVLGIMSPLVVLPGELFTGPYHAPTLEGQYVLKNVILLAAALLIATTVSRADGAARGTARSPEDGE